MLYFSLKKILFRDEYLAYKAALFYCINPASVLFVAPLSFTLVSAASFAAMASIEKGMGIFTGIYLAIATAAKPSGIFHLFLVLYSSMKQVATQTILYVRQKKKNLNRPQQNNYDQVINTFTTIGLSAMLPGIWCIVASLAPFGAFQWFAFAAFCKLKTFEIGQFHEKIYEYGTSHNLSMPGADTKPEWCYKDPPVPHYHLFFEWKEPFIHWVSEDWPHYIACTPALILILWQVSQFYKAHRRYCLRLGLVDNALLGMIKPKVLCWSVSRALPRETLVYLLQAVLIMLCSVSFNSLQVIYVLKNSRKMPCKLFPFQLIGNST